MTISEAIKKARVRRETELPNETLADWLSKLDGQLWEDVVSRYEGQPFPRPAYGPETDPETDLMITAPYDGLYVDYLVMRIDLDHADYDRYSNDAALFSTARQDWANWYNRTHRWSKTKQPWEPRPKYYDTQILF